MLIQTLFTILIVLQFLVMALHDIIEIPGLTHRKQMLAALGPTKVIIGTVINSLLPGVAAAFAIIYWNRPAPPIAVDYWVIYCGITLFGAITAWWIPYFRGTDPKTQELYNTMYANTLQILPPRGDNPRPNVLHLCFHVLFLCSFVVGAILYLRPFFH
jgi:hypothetical protein